MKRFLDLLIAAALILIFSAYFKKTELPTAESINGLESDPLQQPLADPPFRFEYARRTYIVEPVAKYEISGLVVTHNDITAIDDIYHDSSSVDIKDICLIWGDNVADDNFHQLKFWSEPWSCQYRTDDRRVFKLFVAEQLSNNHLLSGDPAVRERIKSARIGDTVHFAGRLVNYYPQDRPEMKRITSTVRTDGGNGACEVVFVDSFEILSRSAEDWNLVYFWARPALLVLLLLRAVIFLLACYRPLRG